MKKAIQISTILITALFYGQSVSNFQYILIPGQFKDEKANKYNLNSLLKSKLQGKKFVVFNETFEERPAGSSNPCDILKAEVTDTSNMFTNKVRIDFKDCNEKTVASLEGKSNIKEFEEGMRAALANSLTNLSPSNPSDQNLVAKQESVSTNTQTLKQENTKIETANPETTLSDVTIFGQNKASKTTIGTIIKAEDFAPKAEV